MPRPLIILLIVTAILAAVFVTFPQIDIWMTGQFYDPQNGGFWLKNNPIILVFYYLVKYARYAMPVVFAVLLAANFLTKKKFLFGRRELAFLFLAALLGPIIVTGFFKDYWHRARPVQTIEFGGDKPFTRAFEISHYCPTDCYSFVSGHAAMGFFFVAFALVIASARKRKKAYICLFLLGMVIAFARVMQGAHYLSDVVFGGLFTLISTHALYYLMYRKVTPS